ncbi:hypothetical protein AMECASPLE_030608 [Ameca splendens]|uniref:Uncharacterized protein n=1 Tax=Ameca splendens TaxID=208324 RepID=A0ABV1A339_9TELE
MKNETRRLGDMGDSHRKKRWGRRRPPAGGEGGTNWVGSMQFIDALDGEDLLLTGEVKWRPLVEESAQSILKVVLMEVQESSRRSGIMIQTHAGLLVCPSSCQVDLSAQLLLTTDQSNSSEPLVYLLLHPDVTQGRHMKESFLRLVYVLNLQRILWQKRSGADQRVKPDSRFTVINPDQLSDP